MKVSFAVSVLHPDRNEASDPAVDRFWTLLKYPDSVLNESALQGWDCVALSLCINGQPIEVLESIEPINAGRHWLNNQSAAVQLMPNAEFLCVQCDRPWREPWCEG